MIFQSSVEKAPAVGLTDNDTTRIVEAFRRSDFGHIELKCGSTTLLLSRPVASPATDNGFDVSDDEAFDTVGAPTVGFFHDLVRPDVPVEPGCSVDDQTPLGVVKTLSGEVKVRAGRSGRIAEKLVKDGGFVEYGQTLYSIRRADAKTTSDPTNGLDGRDVAR